MSIDGRSRLGRRVADLAEDFAQRLGGWASLSDTMIASIRRAAELSSLDRPREPEPMSIEEHLAAYGAVEPREAREPSGSGGSRNATYGQTSHRQRASCATTSTSDHGGRG